MPESPLPGAASLAEAVRRCRRCGSFLAGLGALYAALDAEITRSGAICLGGGACCKFDLAGHRLFLTTGELALLTGRPPANIERCELSRCPYQLGPRCSARDRRPMACRTYFCDSRVTDLSRPMCEAYHRRIRRLHEIHHVPYLYVELTSAIPQLFADP